MANLINNKNTHRWLAMLVALVLVLSIFPADAAAAGYSVDHIDIALNLTATVNIDGVDQNVSFQLTTADKDNVTITNDAGQTMSVTKLSTGSTDNAGNPQIRFEGTFPVGTQSDPVRYTVVLRKTLEVTTAAGKTVSVPVTLTATMHYWDSGNVCPGWSRNPGKQSGIDLVLGNGTGSYTTPPTTGTLQLQKTVSGAVLAEDTTFYFDIYKDGAIYQEDVAVVVEAGGTIGMQLLLNVPLGTYTIVEDTTRAVVAEYVLTDTTYSTDGGQVVIDQTTGYNGIVNVTNIYEEEIITRDLTVTKVWQDLTPGTAHDDIQVQLYRDGEAFGAPVVLNDANGWTFTWEELDTACEWTVAELNCPAGYTATVTYADGVYTLTNTQDPPPPPAPVELTVTKIWANDTPSLRPESILVQLYRNGEAFGEPVALSEANGWAYAWTGLDGSYTWTVDEVAVPEGYVKSISVEDGITVITNAHTDNRIGDAHVSVTKLWDDNGYPDRPTSVTVQLLCEGEPYGDPVVLNADNNWHYTWYEVNEDLTWTISEIDVPEGYTATVAQDGFYFTVTNTMDYEPPTEPTEPEPTEPEPTEPEPTEPEPTEPEPTEPEPTEPEPTEPEPTEPEPTEPEPTEPEPTEPEPTEPEPTEPEPTEPEPTEPGPRTVVDVPVTGSMLSTWIMVSAVSGIGLIGTLMTRKKED